MRRRCERRKGDSRNSSQGQNRANYWPPQLSTCDLQVPVCLAGASGPGRGGVAEQRGDRRKPPVHLLSSSRLLFPTSLRDCPPDGDVEVLRGSDVPHM